jgi:hypothetical protein
MKPETFVEVYHPIFKEMEFTISNLRRELENLKLQKEEQDKHFDRLLQRIKTIATE